MKFEVDQAVGQSPDHHEVRSRPIDRRTPISRKNGKVKGPGLGKLKKKAGAGAWKRAEA